jgi:hypothetical protein
LLRVGTFISRVALLFARVRLRMPHCAYSYAYSQEAPREAGCS